MNSEEIRWNIDLTRSTIVLTVLFIAACSEGNIATDRDDNAAATYRVSFIATWNAIDFPINFPAGPHFSGLIGTTHSNQVKIWEDGQIASAGIEIMAETGSKAVLQSEIETAKAAGTAEFFLSGPGNSGSGTTEFIFDMNEMYSLVSLVSMVAPSPDWFVGVRDLDLYDNVADDWKDSVTINLPIYDAGSDSGGRFLSPNADTQPKSIISPLTSSATDTDFINGIHSVSRKFIGKMVFTRI